MVPGKGTSPLAGLLPHVPSLSSGVCTPVGDAPGLSDTFLLSPPQFWQLFLKLAQTKSALEDSGERGDEACWLRLGGEGSTSLRGQEEMG